MRASVADGACRSRAYEVLILGRNSGGPSPPPIVEVGGAPCAVVSVSDAAIACWVASAAGPVRVRAGGLDSTQAVAFNASRPTAAPLLSSVAGPAGGTLSIQGGAVLTFQGVNVIPTAPSVGVVLAIAGGAMEGAACCRAARGLRSAGAASNWCVRVSVDPVAQALSCVAPYWPRSSVTLVLVVVGLSSCGVSAPWVVLFDAPVVHSVAPSRLPTAGGAMLTIIGTNFEARVRALVLWCWQLYICVGVASLYLCACALPLPTRMGIVLPSRPALLTQARRRRASRSPYRRRGATSCPRTPL